MKTALVKYDAMCRAIAESYKVDEVKSIRDQAIALETYAMQAKNTEAERQACEIRLRAEKRCGELTKNIVSKPGKRNDLTSSGQRTKLEALTEVGISKNQASQWEKLADIPEEQFERALQSEQKPSTTGIIKQFHEYQAKPQKRKEQVFSIETSLDKIAKNLGNAAAAFIDLRQIINDLGGLLPTDQTTFVIESLKDVAKSLRILQELFDMSDVGSILQITQKEKTNVN